MIRATGVFLMFVGLAFFILLAALIARGELDDGNVKIVSFFAGGGTVLVAIGVMYLRGPNTQKKPATSSIEVEDNHLVKIRAGIKAL